MPVPKMSKRNRTPPDDFVSRQCGLQSRPVLWHRAVFCLSCDNGCGQGSSEIDAENPPVFGSRRAFRNVGQRWFIRFQLMRSEPDL